MTSSPGKDVSGQKEDDVEDKEKKKILRLLEEAEKCYKSALIHRPNMADVHYNMLVYKYDN